MDRMGRQDGTSLVPVAELILLWSGVPAQKVWRSCRLLFRKSLFLFVFFFREGLDASTPFMVTWCKGLWECSALGEGCLFHLGVSVSNEMFLLPLSRTALGFQQRTLWWVLNFHPTPVVLQLTAVIGRIGDASRPEFHRFFVPLAITLGQAKGDHMEDGDSFHLFHVWR